MRQAWHWAGLRPQKVSQSTADGGGHRGCGKEEADGREITEEPWDLLVRSKESEMTLTFQDN